MFEKSCKQQKNSFTEKELLKNNIDLTTHFWMVSISLESYHWGKYSFEDVTGRKAWKTWKISRQQQDCSSSTSLLRFSVCSVCVNVPLLLRVFS